MFINRCDFVHCHVINSGYSMPVNKKDGRKRNQGFAGGRNSRQKEVLNMLDPEENESFETSEGRETAKVTESAETESAQTEQPTPVSEPDSYEPPRERPIYADAHYEPAGESTQPPRYYTPPEKPPREPKPKKRERRGLGAVPVICLCLVCALLGGLVAGSMTQRSMSERMSQLEQSVEDNARAIRESEEDAQAAAPVQQAAVPAQTISANQIYQESLDQVVGVSTDVTFTNFFGQTSSSAVTGSGFIISENGYILTNYHVIEYAYEGRLAVTVMTYDGSKYEASIVGVEPSNDVAVLKIDASNLHAARLGNSDEIAVGETVYAVGNPLGELQFSMSTGSVSARDRVISTEAASSVNMFQIDAAVNSGNSGGPVYNSRGEVIGMVTAKSSRSGTEGLGFAIPINDARAIAEDLITKGYVSGKAYMGVRLDERYSAMYAQYFDMPMGAYIYSVESGTAAERAGLQTRDIITAVDDNTVNSFTDLQQVLRKYSAGDSAKITVYRGGETLTLDITFDESVPTNLADSPASLEPVVG